VRYPVDYIDISVNVITSTYRDTQEINVILQFKIVLFFGASPPPPPPIQIVSSQFRNDYTTLSSFLKLSNGYQGLFPWGKSAGASS
jgi:hypothetical protein